MIDILYFQAGLFFLESDTNCSPVTFFFFILASMAPVLSNSSRIFALLKGDWFWHLFPLAETFISSTMCSLVIHLEYSESDSFLWNEDVCHLLFLSGWYSYHGSWESESWESYSYRGRWGIHDTFQKDWVHECVKVLCWSVTCSLQRLALHYQEAKRKCKSHHYFEDIWSSATVRYWSNAAVSSRYELWNVHENRVNRLMFKMSIMNF